MSRRMVTLRLEEDLLKSFDIWAEERGWSRTRAIERIIDVVLSLKPDAGPVSLARFGLITMVGESGPEVGQQKGGNAWEAEEPDVVNQGPPGVMPKPARRVPERPSGPCSHPKSARKMVNGGPFCAPSLGGCGAVIL